ncbi:RNA 3'-terminal phosphate cyclase [Candidatus Woesearchaeota archaeon]|nr:RNA 3'-terminal phosphate cyclase [Candidatus Woesearchaeota archaeon]
MITLDGSYGEGGGALVRTAVALSTLTGIPCSINNIRAGREQPGLKAQHLTIINALKTMSGAQTNNVELGSMNLEFTPGTMKKGVYSFDIGTAGSISLFLQGVLPCCIFAPGRITLKITGGTGGKWQSPVDFTQHVLFMYLEPLVEKIECKILRRGYYPAGGGVVEVTIVPKYTAQEILMILNEIKQEMQKEAISLRPSPFNATQRGPLQQIRGVINVSSQLAEKEVAERIEKTIRLSLVSYKVPISLRTEYNATNSVGGEVVLWAIFENQLSTTPIILSYNELLEKDKTSEQVAANAVMGLRKEIDSTNTVDQFMIDQILIYMAFLPGSAIRYDHFTPHAKTNMYVLEKFLPIQFNEQNGIVQSQRKG